MKGVNFKKSNDDPLLARKQAIEAAKNAGVLGVLRR
jgi:hypothetical protein